MRAWRRTAHPNSAVSPAPIAYFALNEQTRLRVRAHGRPADPDQSPREPGISAASRSRPRLGGSASGRRARLAPPPESRGQQPDPDAVHQGREERGVDKAYKCPVRTPWWRPPVVTPPDLFFTYMSHRYPRLITNKARVTFLNSMHGVRLKPHTKNVARDALPLLVLNSLTMLGAEIYGRSYGGGILKMEPREASTLPVPSLAHLEKAWERLRRGSCRARPQAPRWPLDVSPRARRQRAAPRGHDASGGRRRGHPRRRARASGPPHPDGLSAVANDPGRDLEGRVGHPGDLFDGLIARVQDEAITQFADLEADWLRLMWALDSFRIAGISPRNMGNPNDDPSRRLGAIYRMKGNWFARVIALLLQNQTHQEIKPKGTVIGFSQKHAVDVAWPVRNEDPLVCIETKVTGAPAYGSTRQRGASADWSNRRKEVKFAATDLKLYRRQQRTKIDHWDHWRTNAPPRTYFLWGARLRMNSPAPGGQRRRDTSDRLESMVREAQALVNTYLEGAAIVAWRQQSDGQGYEPVPLPQADRVLRLDDLIHRVADEIRHMAPHGQVPEPEVPPERAVDIQQLAVEDTADTSE